MTAASAAVAAATDASDATDATNVRKINPTPGYYSSGKSTKRHKLVAPPSSSATRRHLVAVLIATCLYQMYVRYNPNYHHIPDASDSDFNGTTYDLRHTAPLVDGDGGAARAEPKWFGAATEESDDERVFHKLSYLGPGLAAEVWKARHENVILMEHEDGAVGDVADLLMTRIRDARTSRAEFVKYVDRMLRFLVEFSLTCVDNDEEEVTDPYGYKYTGLSMNEGVKFCTVTVTRNNRCIFQPFVDCCPGASRHGNLTMQYAAPQPETGTADVKSDASARAKQSMIVDSHLPEGELKDHNFICLDTSLRTGASAATAVQYLLDAGATEERIMFVFLIASPEGIDQLVKAHPDVKIIVGSMGHHLKPEQQNHIVPGIGDFQSRYYGD